jgi:hypothetical protein
MHELGRPETGQHVAVKAVGRAVHLVTFALRHAAESAVPVERLAELTGWEPQLVNEALARAPESSFVARLAPPGLDPAAVARAAAIVEATARLQVLTQGILADVGSDAWSPAPPISSTCTSAWTANGAHGAKRSRTTAAVNES